MTSQQQSIPLMQNFEDNIFGSIECKLKNQIKISLPILVQRCHQDCQKLIVHLKKINQNQIKIMGFIEAITNNEQILEITSQKTKKLNKYNNLHNINLIIKQNAYLIRKFTQEVFTKAQISNMIGLSESSIYFREKQIPKSIQFYTQFYFRQNQLEWLKNYVKSSEIQDLWNQQLILPHFVCPSKKLRERQNLQTKLLSQQLQLKK